MNQDKQILENLKNWFNSVDLTDWSDVIAKNHTRDFLIIPLNDVLEKYPFPDELCGKDTDIKRTLYNNRGNNPKRIGDSNIIFKVYMMDNSTTYPLIFIDTRPGAYKYGEMAMIIYIQWGMKQDEIPWWKC